MKNTSKLISKKDILINQTNSILKSRAGSTQSSDVLVSAVISPYLLTHLHQILQKSEFKAKKDGRFSHATNLAKLRKVLCVDARSMEDASAKEMTEPEKDSYENEQNVA